MKVDQRESYLKKIISLPTDNFRSFEQFYNLSLLFLEDPRTHTASKEVVAVEKMITAWLAQFSTEKGTPTLLGMLYYMDAMYVSDRRTFKIKTRFTIKRFSYMELSTGLATIKNNIMLLIREKARQVRFLNPDIIV